MLVLPDALDPNAPALSDRHKQFRQQILSKSALQYPEQMSVAEAVRLSMSIPLFFEPGRLGDSWIVDGGILSNFPLWIYDVQPRPGQSVAPAPRWPTFGFRLVDSTIGQVSEIQGYFRCVCVYDSDDDECSRSLSSARNRSGSGD
uniref:Patatin-like phospholipase family protein n=1 Tax=Desertifilum tharense IPPAS B-1220 TaxID=1781255 RepID=A0ACD5GVL9_9CYAN